MMKAVDIMMEWCEVGDQGRWVIGGMEAAGRDWVKRSSWRWEYKREKKIFGMTHMAVICGDGLKVIYLHQIHQKMRFQYAVYSVYYIY